MQNTHTPARPGPSVSRKDPTIQVVDSAYQIVTMIGANPRAIRPILAQRRLSKEQVLDAADRLAARAGALLADLNMLDSERRALHESAILELKDQLEAWQTEREVEAAAEQVSAEVARLQAAIDDATAAFARFETEQQRRSALLTGLRERADRVREVYQAL
jgi:chromosome segregation ATPase